MKKSKSESFLLAYNAQAVNSEAPVIVAAKAPHRPPRITYRSRSWSRRPESVSYAAGSHHGRRPVNQKSEERTQVRRIDLQVAKGKQKHGKMSPACINDSIDLGAELSLREQTAQKQKTEVRRPV